MTSIATALLSRPFDGSGDPVVSVVMFEAPSSGGLETLVNDWLATQSFNPSHILSGIDYSSASEAPTTVSYSAMAVVVDFIA